MIPAPQLLTERLILEPIRPSHAEQAWPHVDDDRMWAYFPHLRPAGIADLRRQYAKWERGSPSADQVWWNWLCRERASGALAGSMQATVFPGEDLAYVAYAIYPERQRKGYAREAVLAFMQRVRETFGVSRFRAEMDVRNEPSYRLAESLGFTRVEVREREYVYELGV
ncbi:MAG TPA: GNAT family N-acetyltransferase [Candidatus Baltobacteraceae bacterium]|nr:GNAT family N-acetyltransferase [Candidatus Baltobacteraceae bacterium]